MDEQYSQRILVGTLGITKRQYDEKTIGTRAIGTDTRTGS